MSLNLSIEPTTGLYIHRSSTFRRYLGNKGARDDSYSLVKGAVEEPNEPKNHRVGGHVAMK